MGMMRDNAFSFAIENQWWNAKVKKVQKPLLFWIDRLQIIDWDWFSLVAKAPPLAWEVYIIVTSLMKVFLKCREGSSSCLAK